MDKIVVYSVLTLLISQNSIILSRETSQELPSPDTPGGKNPTEEIVVFFGAHDTDINEFLGKSPKKPNAFAIDTKDVFHQEGENDSNRKKINKNFAEEEVALRKAANLANVAIEEIEQTLNSDKYCTLDPSNDLFTDTEKTIQDLGPCKIRQSTLQRDGKTYLKYNVTSKNEVNKTFLIELDERRQIKNFNGEPIAIKSEKSGTISFLYVDIGGNLSGIKQIVKNKYSPIDRPKNCTKKLEISSAGNLNSSTTIGCKDKWIARSKGLGLRNFGEFNNAQDREPIVSPECIEKYKDAIKDLMTEESDEEYNRKVLTLQAEIKSPPTSISKENPDCSKFFYGDRSSKIPAIVYTHMRNFGKDQKGEVNESATESILLAKLFGYNYYHPYHPIDKYATPISGEDPLRPIFKNTLTPSDFQGQDAPDQPVDKHNFYNEKTLSTDEGGGMSVIARRVLRREGLTDQMINERRKLKKYNGNIDGFLDTMDAMLEEKNGPASLHCQGGKHKTGTFFLALRYLQSPDWLYGPGDKHFSTEKADLTIGVGDINSDGQDSEKYKSLQEENRALTRSKVKTALKKLSYRRYNPAEIEYIQHNRLEVRASNLTSMKLLFRHFYEPENEDLKNQLKKKYGMSDQQLSNIYQRLKQQQERMLFIQNDIKRCKLSKEN